MKRACKLDTVINIIYSCVCVAEWYFVKLCYIPL